jgi:hypothetical protein
MATSKLAEYKEIQDKIVKHLFEKAARVSEADIQKLVGKPTSETKYHLDQLLLSKRIHHDNISHKTYSETAYSITDTGRKWVMEQAQ